MINQKVKRSEKLSTELRRKLTKFIKNTGTKVEAAEKIGISRISLYKVEKNGSCKPETLLKIVNTVK